MRKSAAVVYQFPEQLGADTQTPDGSGLSDPALMRRDTLFQQKWDPGLGGELSKIFISATSSLEQLFSLIWNGQAWFCVFRVPSQMGVGVFGGTEHRPYWSLIKLNDPYGMQGSQDFVACWVVKLWSQVRGKSSENLWSCMEVLRYFSNSWSCYIDKADIIPDICRDSLRFQSLLLVRGHRARKGQKRNSSHWATSHSGVKISTSPCWGSLWQISTTQTRTLQSLQNSDKLVYCNSLYLQGLWVRCQSRSAEDCLICKDWNHILHLLKCNLYPKVLGTCYNMCSYGSTQDFAASQ